MKKILALILLGLGFPIALWLMFGGMLMNYLLSLGIPYGLYLFLGYGGGFFILLILWIVIVRGGLGENDGCIMLMVPVVIVLMVSGVVMLFRHEGDLILDRMFPPRLSVSSDLLNAAGQVCKGIPVNAADSYPGISGQNHLVMMNETGGWNNWTNSLPKAWKPASIASLQLVACAGNITTTTSNVCQFSGGSTLEQKRQIIEIRIIAAKTGMLVQTIQVEGEDYVGCPDSIVVGSSGEQKVATSEIKDTQIIDALTPFVEK